MFVCFANWSSVINLNLFWKQVFSYIKKSKKSRFLKAGNPYWKGRLSTVDILVLTCLGKLILILQTLFTSLHQNLRSTVLSLPLQLVFPAEGQGQTSVNRTKPGPSFLTLEWAASVQCTFGVTKQNSLI